MQALRTHLVLVAVAWATQACERSLPVPDAPDLATPAPGPDFFVQAVPDLISPADLKLPCSAQSAGTVPTEFPHSPLDLILVVDNASTMTDPIVAIQQNIHNNLTRILSLSGIDYRVILISRFGASTEQRICIGPPLGGNMCVPPINGPPKNAPPRFFHYDLALNGDDVLDKLLRSYRNPDPWGLAPHGWSDLLRQNAAKHFVVVSDDDAGWRASEFEFMLAVADGQMFGRPGKPTYVFHAIVGLRFNMPPGKPWGPKDPIQQQTCGNMAKNNGANYQDLAILTGGLRFPICGDFGVAFFTELAKVLLDATKLPPRIPCEVELPQPPPGLMLSSVAVEFLPSNPPMAPPVKLNPVANLAACMPSSFYLTPKSIVLCPDTCTELRKDPMGKLQPTFCWNPL